MELLIKRGFDSFESTTGQLFLDGKRVMFTLEDTYRHEKLYGQSRIPSGRYEVRARFDSPMAKRYELKYGLTGMLWLQDVPGFEWVYLHVGNTAKDSEGCILVGTSVCMQLDEDGNIQQMLGESGKAYEKLHKLCIDAAKSRELWVTIVD